MVAKEFSNPNDTTFIWRQEMLEGLENHELIWSDLFSQASIFQTKS